MKRLRDYVVQHDIRQLSGSYFGPGGALSDDHAPFTGATATELTQLHGTWIAVSVNWLMRPEYAWLRDNHQAVSHIGDSIDIFWLP